MKKLNILAFGLLLLMILGGCRRSESERFQRHLEKYNDSTFEYVAPKKDKMPVQADTTTLYEHAIVEDEGYVTMPDIPGEVKVNKRANDRDAMRLLGGEDLSE
jgi:hypothetical protein